METTPKSMRLQIALLGRTNTGKSSFLNLVSGQDAAITSPIPGTTTDVVEKPMELLPIGPVVFLDTAGLDDVSELGTKRIERTKRVFARADIAVIVCTAGNWGGAEDVAMTGASDAKIPAIAVINKCDIEKPSPEFISALKKYGIKSVIECSSLDISSRDSVLSSFKQALIDNCPEDFITPPPLVSDICGKKGSTVVLLVPIDIQAPKGRIILPQVQTLRDVLDSDCMALTVKENDFADALAGLKTPPSLVVCDSQVVDRMVAETPENITCTTFSILFSRLKGDMPLMAAGAAAIDSLRDGDKVLIAETCTHHATCEDIGRVKIPRLLRKHTGKNITADVCAGHDYPANLSEYRLVIHCGGCMMNRREVLSRIHAAAKAGVPVTNYGMCISFLQGAFERVLSPFPDALEAFRKARNGIR